MIKLPSAALFDLDGVLVDTETIYTEIWTDIERVHPTGVKDFAHVIKGSTLPRILNTYYPDKKEQEEIIADLYARENVMPYPIFDGVIEFLEELRAHSVPAAIVTSSGARKMERLFAQHPGFREYFQAVLTDADVVNSKPDPEGYMKAAARMGAASADAIVFEDSYAGLQAGRAAGGMVVALSTTNPHETLVDKADLVIEGFSGLSLSSLMQQLCRE